MYMMYKLSDSFISMERDIYFLYVCLVLSFLTRQTSMENIYPYNYSWANDYMQPYIC